MVQNRADLLVLAVGVLGLAVGMTVLTSSGCRLTRPVNWLDSLVLVEGLLGMTESMLVFISSVCRPTRLAIGMNQ